MLFSPWRSMRVRKGADRLLRRKLQSDLWVLSTPGRRSRDGLIVLFQTRLEGQGRRAFDDRQSLVPPCAPEPLPAVARPHHA
ncbi:MAG: hypothetical protein LZF60_360091 [Nitrospira sp.]|nr:MAG: hypothetical protein LZF60_360091 [Nitrospira sp.]